MLKISRIIVLALLPLSAQLSWAGDRKTEAMVGGALGGVIGSIVGSQMGGRDGAVVGAGLGALAGVAIAADGGHRHDRYERVRYVDERYYDDYRGGYHRGHHIHHRDHHAHYRGHHRDRDFHADRGRHASHRSHHHRH